MVRVCRLEATFLQMGFSVSPEIDKLWYPVSCSHDAM